MCRRDSWSFSYIKLLAICQVLAAKLPPAGVATVNSNPVPAEAYEAPKVNVPFVTLPPVVDADNSKVVALVIDATYAADGIPVPLTDIPTRTLAVLSIVIVGSSL